MVKRLQMVCGVQYAWWGRVKEEMIDRKKRVDPMNRSGVGSRLSASCDLSINAYPMDQSRVETRFIASYDLSINAYPTNHFANDVHDEHGLFRWTNT